MEFVADLHLHSRYSRAVSQSMNLETMAEYAYEKGLNLLSASDFTHPVWLKEIKSQLEEFGQGVYRLRTTDNNSPVYFLLSTEIANIYKQGEKLRRIHNLIFAPTFEIVEKINKELLRRGANLSADGRPIIGLSSRNLLELILEIDPSCMLIPCHAWTPHFGVYGSKSGFDSLTECFEDLESYVYAIETGISSDPEMNWRVSELKNRSIVSFSDAHSPANMAREATAFQLADITYENVRKAIMKKGRAENRISYTIEFYPEEGKYHFSGHRNCNISFSPQQVLEKGSVCPVCKREFTEGVAIRIEQLAGAEFAKEYLVKESPSGIKWHTDSTKNHPSYVKLVRLIQIIAEALESTVNSQKVKDVFDRLILAFGSELQILLKTPIGEIGEIGGSRVGEGVEKVRKGDIVIEPGFDGEYGKVRIWEDGKSIKSTKGIKGEEVKEQMGLF